MNCADEYGVTPIHGALYNGRSAIAQLLLEWGAKLPKEYSEVDLACASEKAQLFDTYLSAAVLRSVVDVIKKHKKHALNYVKTPGSSICCIQ